MIDNMIESGKYILQISQMIAILKTELEQNGRLNLLDNHRFCESLVMNLLNLTYKYKLENLNKDREFEGLDIGSTTDEKGIGYEISADNSRDRIDRKLETIRTRRHYVKYNSIRFFMLKKKLTNYSIRTQTEPAFTFNWRKDIYDFDDLLKEIRHLKLDELKAIYTYLASELPLIHEFVLASKPKQSFFKRLFGLNPVNEDSEEAYDMTANLWNSIKPENSNYVQKSKVVNSIPSGIQFFTFEYGQQGHAWPLNLKGKSARVEIQFTCKVTNPMRAIKGGEFALNYLQPQFVLESRGILEQYAPQKLRNDRLKVALEIKNYFHSKFQDKGLSMETVTIGAIDVLP